MSQQDLETSETENKFSMEHDIYIKVEPMAHNQDTPHVAQEQDKNVPHTECSIKNEPDPSTYNMSTPRRSSRVAMHIKEEPADVGYDDRTSLPVTQLTDTFKTINRPSEKQVEGLVEFLEKNPGIARGIMRTAYAKHATKKKWNDIAPTLNAIGVAQKDGKGWAKYWADKKFALKKACFAIRQSGGPEEVLSPICQRLVDVMGCLESAGDSHGTTTPTPNPTPSSSQPVPTQNKDVLIVIEPSTVSVDTASNNRLEQLEVDADDDADVDTVPVQHERERSPLRPPPAASRRKPKPKQGSSLNEDRNRFAAIEERRVEAEVITAEALRDAAQNMSSIASAVNNLADSVREAAQILAQAIRATHTPNTT